MMMSQVQKIKFLFLSFLIFAMATASSRGDVLLASVYEVSEKRQIRWSISDQDYASLPRYEQKGGVPPLALSEAVKLAEAHCRKAYKEGKIQLDSATFKQPMEYEKRDQVFFFFITFEITKESGDVAEFDVLVLPTNKILEPKG